MIRTDTELEEARARLAAEKRHIEAVRADLEKDDLPEEHVQRALDPLRSFHEGLKDEVAAYLRLKSGDLRDFAAVLNLNGLGWALIAARIARGISQAELARRLAVDASQVSRDERNGYSGISVSRAQRVLDALGVELHSSLDRSVIAEEMEDQHLQARTGSD